jgi:hypothetical protein
MIMMSDMVDELVRLGASQEEALETALKCKGSTTGSESMQLVTMSWGWAEAVVTFFLQP